MGRFSEAQINLIGLRTFAVSIFVMPLVFIIWQCNKNNTFEKNSVITTGTVFGMETVPRYKTSAGTRFFYKYQVNNDVYYESSVTNGNSSRYENFNSKTFPLLYNPSDPKESYLLVTQSDYDRFGLTMPDSMAWVREYER